MRLLLEATSGEFTALARTNSFALFPFNVIVSPAVNSFGFNSANLGNMLFRATPLIMTGLSVAVAYKTGLFNIGAAGQYCFGVALSLYAALGLGWSWLPCLLVAISC